MIFIRKFVYSKFMNNNDVGSLNKAETAQVSRERDSKEEHNKTHHLSEDNDKLSDLDSNDALSSLSESGSEEFQENLKILGLEKNSLQVNSLFDLKDKQDLCRLLKPTKDCSLLAIAINPKSVICKENLSRPIQVLRKERLEYQYIGHTIQEESKSSIVR